MKKIPTLFERVYEGHRIVGILPNVAPGCEWVLNGEGEATVKYDGSCCAIIGGKFYKRFDAKGGKPIPEGAMKCQDAPDPVTGHMPCWVRCDRWNPTDRWFWAAYDNSGGATLNDWTYEAVGPHFQKNPHGLAEDVLVKHGVSKVVVERTFEGIRDYLAAHEIEGLVFWKDGEPRCKIKRSDFGMKWGAQSAREGSTWRSGSRNSGKNATR